MNEKTDFLSRLADEFGRPLNPDSKTLGLGYTLTGEDGQRYVIVGARYESHSFMLCRLPPSMTVEDLGRKFFHKPIESDFGHFELL